MTLAGSSVQAPVILFPNSGSLDLSFDASSLTSSQCESQGTANFGIFSIWMAIFWLEVLAAWPIHHTILSMKILDPRQEANGL